MGLWQNAFNAALAGASARLEDPLAAVEYAKKAADAIEEHFRDEYSEATYRDIIRAPKGYRAIYMDGKESLHSEPIVAFASSNDEQQGVVALVLGCCAGELVAASALGELVDVVGPGESVDGRKVELVRRNIRALNERTMRTKEKLNQCE